MKKEKEQDGEESTKNGKKWVKLRIRKTEK